mmetsp:Transcript_8386/g.23628  ORF Transcript_8386/g.23628 Transcript_8386/m.23628 type:complete len:200 (+) Transcript_8386:81-680(+)
MKLCTYSAGAEAPALLSMSSSRTLNSLETTEKSVWVYMSPWSASSTPWNSSASTRGSSTDMATPEKAVSRSSPRAFSSVGGGGMMAWLHMAMGYSVVVGLLFAASLRMSSTAAGSKAAGAQWPSASGRSRPPLGAIQMSSPPLLSILDMVDSVWRFCFCLAAFSSGMSSMCFLLWMQNRLRPMLNGLQMASLTTRSPAT